MKKLILILVTLSASCSNINQQGGKNKTAEKNLNPFDSLALHDSLEGYSCWINPEVDSTINPETVKLTFQIIDAVPDAFIITDSTIGSIKGGDFLSYSLFEVGGDGKHLKYGSVLIPKLNHSTPRKIIENILKAISKRDTIYELQIYSSKEGYCEMIKNNAPRTDTEWKEKHKIIWNSYVGVLHHGKFYENTFK